ncbi:hypothetical protein I6E52_07830 [Salinibacterium sp. NG253]|uniref:hypothetical protein n=1 Tax=Salinibacterium sp. NG253 TaxID=2792039 RepID=UPI0018CE16BD|nr:hypothetical protein [Salinibacterium sp. NG253]MBH0116756.1 hypothetical protein [Salinibacterium sp. NG253]
MDTQQPISYWVKLVDRIIDELFATTLEEHGITRRQWQLLTVLSKGAAGVELLDIEIAPFLDRANGAVPPTQGLHTTSLESLNELVESEWLTTDGALFELTDRGRVVVDRLTVVIAAGRQKATEGVTPEQYETTVTVLETMAKNLTVQSQ